MFGSAKAELRQQVTDLELQVGDLERQVRDAQYNMAQSQEAVRQAGHVAVTIEGLMAQGNISAAAGSIAMQECLDDEKARLMAEEAERLKSEHADRWRTQYRAEHGAEVTAEVNDQLMTTGVYETIEAGVTAAIKADIHQAALDKLEADARTELDTPEAREEFTTQVADELEASGEAERIRQAVRAELEQVWRPAAIEDVKAQVTAEVATEEDDFKDGVKQTWRHSYQGEQFIAGVRRRLQAEWQNAGTEEIQLAVEDKELIDLVEAILAKEKERLRREMKAKELLTAFEGRGLAVNELEPDTRLNIYLGTLIGSEKVQIEQTGRYGTSEDTKVVMRYGRMLSLVALGDGKFTVNFDSLSDSKSQYEQAAAIHQGTVVVIGRRRVENGTEELTPYVSAGVDLHYDTDTTDPAITSGLLPVLNVEVDGLPARPFDAKTDDTSGTKHVIKAS